MWISLSTSHSSLHKKGRKKFHYLSSTCSQQLYSLLVGATQLSTPLLWSILLTLYPILFSWVLIIVSLLCWPLHFFSSSCLCIAPHKWILSLIVARHYFRTNKSSRVKIYLPSPGVSTLTLESCKMKYIRNNKISGWGYNSYNILRPQIPFYAFCLPFI